MVKIHAAAPADAPSKSSAFLQTESKVSCASSSALPSSRPERRMKVFTRGAKCANSSANASRS